MSNAQQKKAPTPDDVLRRMLGTPPEPFTPKPKAERAKPRKKKA